MGRTRKEFEAIIAESFTIGEADALREEIYLAECPDVTLRFRKSYEQLRGKPTVDWDARKYWIDTFGADDD